MSWQTCENVVLGLSLRNQSSNEPKRGHSGATFWSLHRDLELREVEGREEDDGRQSVMPVVTVAVERSARRGRNEQDHGEKGPDQRNRPAKPTDDHLVPLLSAPKSGPTLLPW